ncbi:sensor kinase/phosphatase LuxQ [Seminavis robusta]|uniref:histidine kinase n=1 Tax=Seminavis robusta TaxID=568900 RepID=A0A9N8EFR4_9STRA|nr:sensor kinase/phosphatase LuxQ [Seminavis robusta]|eukprot:Sro1090_g240120.1 sensor kinase/phosphatase LuxQ (1204) ;mRNA; f:838-4919
MRFSLDHSNPDQPSEMFLDDVELASRTSESRRSKASTRSANSSNHSSKKKKQRQRQQQQQQEEEAAEDAKRKSSTTVASVILILGCAATGAFWAIGVLTAIGDSQKAFEQDVERLAHRVYSAFREYETAGLWIQQSSSSHHYEHHFDSNSNNQSSSNNNNIDSFYAPNFRSYFRELYDAVVAQGLPLYAIQYIPNVTHSERDWYEQEAKQFYKAFYPDLAKHYNGFSGVATLPKDDPQAVTAYALQPLPPAPFYYPIHFVEPIRGNEQVIDMDIYSMPGSRRIVDLALSKMQSHITGRVRLLQEPTPPDSNVYSVFLVHPGRPSTAPYDQSGTHNSRGDVSLLAIRIPELLEFLAQQDHMYESLAQSTLPNMKVYLYDSTLEDNNSNQTTEPAFLGAAEFHCDDVEVEKNDDDYTHILPMPEVSYADLSARTDIRFHTETIVIGQRNWTVACIAGEGTYPSGATLSILAGAMILVGFVCLALWINSQMNRATLESKLKAKSQEEQALLRIDHAKKAAAAERQLNEFIAHEVRNPLAAAMSACSFVTSALQQESEAEEEAAKVAATHKTNDNHQQPPAVPAPLFSTSATADNMSSSSTTPKQHQQQDKPAPLFSLAPSSSSVVPEQESKPAPLFAIPSTSSSSPIKQEKVAPLFAIPPSSTPTTSTSSEQDNNDRPAPLFSLAPSSSSEPKQGNNNTPAPPLFAMTSSSSSSTSQENKPAPLFSLTANTTGVSDSKKELIKNRRSSAPPAPLFPTSKPLPVLESSSATHIVAGEDTREAILADCHIIDSSLQFINDLLRNMLDVQRAACHQLNIEKGPTDLKHDILEPIEAMLYMRGRSVDVQLDCGSTDDLNFMVETDRLRLKQVVLNLGRNAAKFVENGYVRFSVKVVPARPPPPPQDEETTGDKRKGSKQKKNKNKVAFLEQAPSPNQETVQIWIEDTGPGIPEEKKQNLFGKFQESLDTLSQGTGLGLSLVKILVKLMGGEVWLDETYHSGFDDRPGARFIIDLNAPPIRMEDTTPLEVEGDIEAQIAGGVEEKEENRRSLGNISQDMPTPDALPATLSVLMVDDDSVLRKLLVRAVRRIGPGWSIQEAASGEAALRLIDQDNTFDLIFMDQYMASTQKQLLGTEATRALRSKGVRAKICGLSANEMAKDFFAAGANAFVCKPMPTRQETLRQVLADILQDEQTNRRKQSSLVKTPVTSR